MLRFFTSLKTAIALLGAGIFFFFAGTLIIPKTMELYTNIIDTILFQWLRETSPLASWWIVGIVFALGLLAVNTVICTADALIKRVGKQDLMKVLSPQIVHIGVLLILFGHFLTSASGFRGETVMLEGDTYWLSETTAFHVNSISVQPSERTGVRWDVHGAWLENDEEVKQVSVRPSEPSYYKGLWMVIKSADRVEDEDGNPTVQTILMARRDPGVFWAGAGAVLFAIGCMMIAISRRRE